MALLTLTKPLNRLLLPLSLLTLLWSPSGLAQTNESTAQLKQRAQALMEQLKYTEALPVLEKVIAAEPNDDVMRYLLASALLGQAANTKEESDRKALRARARNEFIKAKELGNTQPNLGAMIQSLPVDGSDAAPFSENVDANALMIKGEALFSQGKLDEAFKIYQQALELDPNLYLAALFSGDVFLHKQDYAQAEVWYQKAIAIDPNKETAYRYSATPLMKQGKTDLARDRYVESFITEPYSRFSRAGLVQWGQATNTALAHPTMDIPTSITFDEKGEAKINLDASALLGPKDDGSFAWISYGVTRSAWRKEKFAKTYPNEKIYRHSLAEEADALRRVISMAVADKRTKTLSPALAKLKKLEDEGLLEAYILMAKADQGIAQDHPAFLKNNREKLRRYVTQYVLKGAGQ
jgi:tetratricopeptide (TPR) repeat protein